MFGTFTFGSASFGDAQSPPAVDRVVVLVAVDDMLFVGGTVDDALFVAHVNNEALFVACADNEVLRRTARSNEALQVPDTTAETMTNVH